MNLYELDINDAYHDRTKIALWVLVYSQVSMRRVRRDSQINYERYYIFAILLWKAGASSNSTFTAILLTVYPISSVDSTYYSSFFILLKNTTR